MTTRRGILGLLAASPFAAKHAAEAARLDGIAELPSARDALCEPGVRVGEPADYWTRSLARKGLRAAAIKAGAVPEIVLADMRRRAYHVSAIDPDIAALVAMSRAAKIALQRERNYARELHRMCDTTFDLRELARPALGEAWRDMI